MHERFNRELLEPAALRIQERNLREIERAIDRLKSAGPEWDSWFRRERYRAAWRRRDRGWLQRKRNCDRFGAGQNG